MGLFDFGTLEEKRTQMFFRDNEKVTFRPLCLDGTSLVEKVNNKPVAAFKRYYKSEFPFAGYGKMPAARVTLGYPRDIVLDPFGILAKGERPPTIEELAGRRINPLSSPFVAKIGADKRYRLSAKKPSAAIWDKYTVVELIAIILLGFAILIKVAMK